MINHGTTQLITLYLENPGKYFSHPWYCVNNWLLNLYVSVRLKDELPHYIYIYENHKLYYYWNRDEILYIADTFKLEKLFIEKNVELMTLSETYLSQEILDRFNITRSYFRLTIYKFDFQRKEYNSPYQFKTINLKNDRTRHINLLTTMFEVSEQKLNDYFNLNLEKENFAIIMIDPSINRPLGLGLGSFDRIISEGVIDHLEVTPKFEHLGIREMLINELTARLFRRANFITTSVSDEKDLKWYFNLSYKLGGKWYELKRKY